MSLDATSPANADPIKDWPQYCREVRVLMNITTADPVTFANTDATPSVLVGNAFITTGSTAITNFDDGTLGQTISIYAIEAITITHDATKIVLNGATNFVMAAKDTLTLKMFATDIWTEISRSVNS